MQQLAESDNVTCQPSHWFPSDSVSWLHFVEAPRTHTYQPLPFLHTKCSYIVSMKDEDDVREYLHGLLGDPTAGHGPFIDKFMSTWKSLHGTKSKNKKSTPPPAAATASAGSSKANKKATDAKKPEVQKTDGGGGGGGGDKSGGGVKAKVKQPATTSSGTTKISPPQRGSVSSGSKTKTKYTPLFSKEGQDQLVIKLPGRCRCECQASKHKLINNCVKCGRIVCSQEGSGPCLFCGNQVCTNEEMAILETNTKNSQELLKKLMGDDKGSRENGLPDLKKSGDGLSKAILHKNQLLEYDRTVERRTKVIDDQSDYFTVDNRWLSKEEREALEKRQDNLKEQREKARKSTKVTFDFAGRQIVQEKEDFEDTPVDEAEFLSLMSKDGDDGCPPNMVDVTKPQYRATVLEKSKCKKQSVLLPDSQKGMRLQDVELQYMSDDGQCLSVHQPYASLLVTGLKKHEGRSWYTPFRGRLWVASAAKEPNAHDVRDIENTLRALHDDENLRFPTAYPTSVLLGCVTLTDCVTQEEYRKMFPDGECEAPYVFICDNPHILTVKFPIKGQNKIHKLDVNIHHAAKKGLRAIPKFVVGAAQNNQSSETIQVIQSQ